MELNLEKLDERLNYANIENMTQKEAVTAAQNYRAAVSVLMGVVKKSEREQVDSQADITRLNKQNSDLKKKNKNLNDELNQEKNKNESLMEKLELSGEIIRDLMKECRYSGGTSERAIAFLEQIKPEEAADQTADPAAEVTAAGKNADSKQEQKQKAGGESEKSGTQNNDSAEPSDSDPKEEPSDGTHAPREEKGKASKKGHPQNSRLTDTSSMEIIEEDHPFPPGWFEEHPEYVQVDDYSYDEYRFKPGELLCIRHKMARARLAQRRRKQTESADSPAIHENDTAAEEENLHGDEPNTADVSEQGDPTSQKTREAGMNDENKAENKTEDELKDKDTQISDKGNTLHPVVVYGTPGTPIGYTQDLVWAAADQEPLFPGCRLGPDLLSKLIVDKHLWAIPYDRNCKMFQAQGVDLYKQIVNGYLKKVYDLLRPLYYVMLLVLRQCKYLGADETPALCLEELQLHGRQQCYFVQFITAPCEKIQISYYEFKQNRNQEFVTDILDQTRKYVLVSDFFPGYLGWDFIINVGCHDHARRPFAKYLMNHPKYSEYRRLVLLKGVNSQEVQDLLNAPGNQKFKDCVIIIDTYGALYHNEHIYKASRMSSVEIAADREKNGRPLIQIIENIVDAYTTKRGKDGKPKDGKIYVDKASNFGKGVQYFQNHRKELEQFLLDGNAQISNILCEQGMRPFQLIDNNSMFYDTVQGAKQTALYMSLVRTCRQNHVLPESYMVYAMKEAKKLNIPAGFDPSRLDEETIEKIKKILPCSDSLPEYLKESSLKDRNKKNKN